MYTILIVEDNALNMKLFADVLAKEGYNIVKISDPHEAEIAVLRYQPDLVLLDIYLPGLSGLTLARRLRESAFGRNLPIIATSACVGEADVHSAKMAGCTDFLAKPISFPALLGMVRHHLGLDTARAEGA